MKSDLTRHGVMALAMVASLGVFAGDTDWKGTVDELWATEGNWSAGLPDATKSVGFGNQGGTINLGGEIREIKNAESINNGTPLVLTAEAGGGLHVLGGDFCVGRVGNGTLVLQSGTYTFDGNVCPGWYLRSWNTEDPPAEGRIVVENATVNYPQLRLGTDRGYGIVEIKSGTVKGKYVAIAPGYHAETKKPAYGLLTIAEGGTLDLSGSNMEIGVNGTGELQLNGGTIDNANYIGVGQNSTGVGRFLVNGGTINMSANLNIGNGGSGYFELKNCMVTPNGFSIGCTAEKTGEAVIGAGGRVGNRGNDIELRGAGSAKLTIKDGGEAYTKYWLKLCANGSGTADCVLNLENGGTYTGGSIGKGSGTGAAIVNFNGGILKQEEAASGYQTLIQSNMGDINVGPKGMIVDTALRNNDVFGNIQGVGFLEKRSNNNLWVKNAVDLKRGVRVMGGNLSLEKGFVTATTATTPVKEIYVAEGCSLDLKGNLAEKPTIYVTSYTRNGSLQTAGAYDDYNATIVVIEGADTVATATWTGAAGTDDVADPANWACRNAAGVTVFDALPNADVAVRVPLTDATRAIDFSSVACASLVFVASGEQTFPRGAVAPAIVKSAIAWYDFADTTAATVEQGLVVGFRNKGTAGAALDAGAGDATSLPSYGLNKLNGLDVLSSTNTKGLVSAGGAGLKDDEDRTIIVLARSVKDTYQKGSKDDGSPDYRNEAFYLGLENGSDDRAFRIEDRGWTYNWQYGQGGVLKDVPYSAATSWKLMTMSLDQGTVTGWSWGKDEDATFTATPAEGVTVLTDPNDPICIGWRRQFNSPSACDVAEAMVFNRALTAAERAEIQTYINAKWFTGSVTDTLPKAIELTDGATIDLNHQQLALDSLSGSGVLRNGEVSIATLEVVVDDEGSVSCVSIDGDLDLSQMTVKIVNARALTTNTGLQTILSVTGSLGGTVKAVVADDGRDYALAVDGKSLTIRRKSGLYIIVR